MLSLFYLLFPNWYNLVSIIMIVYMCIPNNIINSYFNMDMIVSSEEFSKLFRKDNYGTEAILYFSFTIFKLL
jgi:hypothetical protein